MIKKIELWDFECHEHSVLDDLDSGLNLIFGESDSGKTSIVRALRLVAYNEFDPRCVRTGKKNCRVRVDSNRGWVEVERGTNNVWTTCRNGDTPQVFEKIGKSILPEAAEILGLHVVELGDMKLPVNVMDQNEGHFMLNELGGDSASGSMRAQIVDEISGLSGIEGLIKEVSLDRHRFGRMMKENEDHALKLRESMHDKAKLQAEEKLLDEAEDLLNESSTNRQLIEFAADLFERHHDAQESAKKVEAQLNAIPNTKILKSIVGKAQAALDKAKSMNDLADKHRNACIARDDVENRIAEIPDVDAVRKAIAESEKAIAKSEAAWSQASKLNDAIGDLEDKEKELEEISLQLARAEAERNAALSEIDVCPLSDRPISKECLGNLKFPVRSDA